MSETRKFQFVSTVFFGAALIASQDYCLIYRVSAVSLDSPPIGSGRRRMTFAVLAVLAFAFSVAFVVNLAMLPAGVSSPF